MKRLDDHTRNERWSGDRSKRRGFLQRIGSLLTGLASWRASGVLLGTSGAMTGGIASAAAGAVAPRYLPQGYRLVNQYTNRPDGFRGGSSELALWYMNLKHPLGFNRPLTVFQALHPQKELAATEGHPATPVLFTVASGQQVTAAYQDGMWLLPQRQGDPPTWAQGDIHSLTFKLGGLMVGVRGSRLAGASRDDLLRVAASLG